MLISTLARYYNVADGEVFAGNGSDEILAFCFPAFFNTGDVISFPEITYSFYPVYSDLFGLKYETIPLNEDYTVNIDGFHMNAKGILLANPNAPTGIALELRQLKIFAKHSDKLVIVDETCVDFGAELAIPSIKDTENL